MRNEFDPKKYGKVEKINDEDFQAYMASEIVMIYTCPNRNAFIDIGSGYGRIIPHIYKKFDRIVAIDNNAKMTSHLNKNFPDVESLIKDATNLDKVVDLPNNSLIAILQNTLGTWDGEYVSLLKNVRSTAKRSHSDVIISLLKSKSLKTWGLKIYSELRQMTGDFDREKSDLKNGIFIGNKGYMSKWFTDSDIKSIKKIMNTESREISTDKFSIIYFSYK